MEGRASRPSSRRGRPALHQQSWIDSSNNHAVAAPAWASWCTLGPGKPVDKSGLRSGDFRYIGRLRPFLSLHNLKLHLIALLQALVAFGGD